MLNVKLERYIVGLHALLHGVFTFIYIYIYILINLLHFFKFDKVIEIFFFFINKIGHMIYCC